MVDSQVPPGTNLMPFDFKTEAICDALGITYQQVTKHHSSPRIDGSSFEEFGIVLSSLDRSRLYDSIGGANEAIVQGLGIRQDQIEWVEWPRPHAKGLEQRFSLKLTAEDVDRLQQKHPKPTGEAYQSWKAKNHPWME